MPGPIPTGRRAFVRVWVQTATEEPDGSGGYTEVWASHLPPWDVAIDATGGSGERVAAGTVVGQATVGVTGPYRTDVSMKARLRKADGSLLRILAITRPDGRDRELVLTCAEAQL